MKAVALISGGKDSCYNMMQCIAEGHSIVALANLEPQLKDEIDSFMYQTVGHQGIDLFAEAIGLPLYREKISGTAVDKGKIYNPTNMDEVEDLYRLLSKIKDELAIEAVAVGAILSDYQRIRVENVCQRLGLVSLAYLWRRNQKELLQEMISSGIEAIIIKVAALGLDPRLHLGMTLREIEPHLHLMEEKYGLNICGEGGEYETFTLDCPLFKKRLVIDSKDLVMHSDDPIAPVGYLNLTLHLESKEDQPDHFVLPPSVKNSSDFIGDLNDSVFSDISDIELSETELESIEKLEKEAEKEKEMSDSISPVSDETFELCHLDEDSLNDPVIDHSSIEGNEFGWYFIGGIVGESSEMGEATRLALEKLITLLESKGLQLQDVCSVNIYMSDMGQYAALNKVYKENFCFSNPPARVCVQCPLSSGVGLILDAVAYKPEVTDAVESEGCESKEKVTMHVQSISHWAPANIGPYSQAVKMGSVVRTCGQIALVAGSMRLVEGGARRQCALALRHVSRVLRATHPRAHLRSVVQSVCYVCSVGDVGAARRQLERRTAGALAQYVVVDALPRAAAAEWHAWAHLHNNTFEYEETGCNVNEYKVGITRRWNYENNVTACVCHVSTESCREVGCGMSEEQLTRVFQYAVDKLVSAISPEGPTRPCILALTIFYQRGRSPPSCKIVHGCRSVTGVRAVCCAVPVTALHDPRAFLSIAGMRLDR